MKTQNAVGAIWIVSDGNPGEFNQALAVAEALAGKGYGPILWVKARPLRGIVRRTPGWFLKLARGPLPRRAEALLVEGDWPEQRPSLVISSGGKTAHLNVSITRRYACANVFIGVSPQLSPGHFSVIMHTRPSWSLENGLLLDILPTRLSAAAARERSQAYRHELGLGDQRLAAMLIGGDCKGYKYHDSDWKALALGMNRLAAAHAFRWLVTTSRRTGAAAESMLRSLLDPALVADSTWWGSEPRPVVLPYLSVSDVIFCTDDSRTMLSEGVASGKPVYALLPEQPSADVPHDGFVALHESSGRLRRVDIAGMGGIDPARDMAGYFRLLTADVMEDMVERLLAMLAGRPRGWRSKAPAPP